MIACLTSATVLPSFAAIGSDYHTDPYELNGSRGYCESNFAFNANVNYIMYGETKVVGGSTCTGTLTVRVHNASGSVLHEGDPASGTGTLSSSITQSDFEEISSTTQCYIQHIVKDSGTKKVDCKYRGYWDSPTTGWDYIVRVTGDGLLNT